MPLSDRQIRALKPTGTRYIVWDGHGLGVRVGAAGTRTWIFIYQFQQKRKQLTIGVYPTVSLRDARRRLADAKQQLAAGVDPIEARREAERTARVANSAGPLTVSALAERYITLYARDNRANWRDDQRALERDVLPSIGNRPAAELRRREVLNVLDAIVSRGAPVMANRTGSLLAAMYSWAVDRDLVAASPLVGLKPVARERPVERALTEPEIARFWQRLPTASLLPMTATALRLQLMLGLRSGEIAAGRWSEIDWQDATWTLPATRTKQRKTHLVCLPLPVVDQLRELQALTGRSPWLFPSYKRDDKSTETHLTRQAVSRAVLRNQKHFGLAEPWTPHDLRRTVRTQFGKMGVQPHIAERCIGHSVGGLAQVYDRYQYLDEQRAAITAWNERLQRIVTGGADVVDMSTHRD